MPKKPQEAEAAETVRPLWPENFMPAESESGASLSPVPIMGVIGQSSSGKTSLYLHLAPVRKGKGKSRTLVYDAEGSAVPYTAHLELVIRDIRELAEAYAKRQGRAKYTTYDLFLAWKEDVERLTAGEFDVIAIDTIDALIPGAQKYVVDHATEFSKHEGQFKGEKGTIFSYGEIAELFRRILLGIAEKTQTVVWASHVKEDFKKPGTLKSLAKDYFTHVSSLILWLKYETRQTKDGELVEHREAQVQKSRLTAYIWEDAEGNELPEPMIADVLPKRLVLNKANGVWQTYPQVIREYMANPRLFSDELNIIPEEDQADQIKMTEQEKMLLQSEADRNRLEMEEKSAKQMLVRDMRERFPAIYPDANAILNAFTALEIEYVLSKDMEIRAALIKRAEELSNGGQSAA